MTDLYREEGGVVRGESHCVVPCREERFPGVLVAPDRATSLVHSQCFSYPNQCSTTDILILVVSCKRKQLGFLRRQKSAGIVRRRYR